jgi:hypothetical protein
MSGYQQSLSKSSTEDKYQDPNNDKEMQVKSTIEVDYAEVGGFSINTQE